MKQNPNRRSFITTAGMAALATGLVYGQEQPNGMLKILGISCSPRKGMTTANAVQAALDAARGLDARIQVELIDLGGLNIRGWSPQPPQDDFTSILPKLQDPAVAGLIFGSPSYFRGLSSLCKAFIERCAPLREPKMLLADKPVGVVAVGAFRNGGQELVIEQIQTAMLCFGMIPVGGRAPAFQGGTLLSRKDDISGDELGLGTARNAGLRVAEFVLRLAQTPARGSIGSAVTP
jgi:multimeric flavodoxin WrbA